MRRLKAIILSLVFFLAFTLTASRFTLAANAASKVKNPAVSASMAKNKRTVAASFSNLANVKSISYQLTYSSTKGKQGAGGTVTVGKSKKLSRALTLGTCSNKVCTYHQGVKGAKLAVTFKLKSGGSISKTVKL
ncbi:MAG: hypothetical protein Q7S79_03350 [bacterium]|nr:hypothetical protein [bacterium]